MGWGRTLFLGDMGNRLDIEDCEQDILAMKTSLIELHDDSQAQDSELSAMRRENDQLKLYLAAAIRLLISKNVLSQDEIARMVDVIDGEDGAMDGKACGEVI